jgi:hypothetical protein
VLSVAAGAVGWSWHPQKETNATKSTVTTATIVRLCCINSAFRLLKHADLFSVLRVNDIVSLDLPLYSK